MPSGEACGRDHVVPLPFFSIYLKGDDKQMTVASLYLSLFVLSVALSWFAHTSLHFRMNLLVQQQVLLKSPWQFETHRKQLAVT